MQLLLQFLSSKFRENKLYGFWLVWWMLEGLILFLMIQAVFHVVCRKLYTPINTQMFCEAWLVTPFIKPSQKTLAGRNLAAFFRIHPTYWFHFNSMTIYWAFYLGLGTGRGAEDTRQTVRQELVLQELVVLFMDCCQLCQQITATKCEKCTNRDTCQEEGGHAIQ